MFKQIRIKYSDLDLLTKIFTGTKSIIYVFDPEGKVVYDADEDQEWNHDAPKVLFNFGKDLVRYKELELSDFDQIIDFGNISKISTKKSAQFCLVQNPNNELKWIFNPKDNFQSYLTFFNATSLRSKLIRTFLKVTSKLKMNSLFSSSFRVYYNDNLHCDTMYENDLADNYSIYCGAPGALRKPVMLFTLKGEPLAFVKFAISKSSLKQIEQERKVLKKLANSPINEIKVPALLKANSELAIATSPLVEKSESQASKKNLINRAIKAISIQEVRHQKLSFLPIHREIKNHIFWLKNKKEYPNIFSKLEKIEDQLDSNQYLYTSLSHGDFSPWNLKEGSEIGIYDWEMAQNERPILYDFFHYHMMNEILVNRKLSASQIYEKIKEEGEAPKIKYLIKRFKIDLKTNFRIYLLHNVSAQLILMFNTKSLSADHRQLLRVWDQVLEEVLIDDQVVNQRQTVLRDFEKFLKLKPYVAMKFLHRSFADLPVSSDLDLATSKRQLPSIIKHFRSSRFLSKLKVEKLGHMTVLKLFLSSGEFLAVDLIHEFSRKGMVYLDIELMIERSEMHGNIKRPDSTFELAYIQAFYFLNNSDVPVKYQVFLSRVFKKDFHKMASLIFSRLYLGIDHKNFNELFVFSPEKKKTIIQHMRVRHNIGPSYTYRRLRYLLRNSRNVFKPKGKVVTFSGVDGAGKTTVINEVTEALKSKYRKEIVYLRHRPGILPILSTIKYGSSQKAEQLSSENLPRQGKNRSSLSSILRFSYYFTDYILGQIFVRVKYLSRDKIVIYDRYYFDFINDSKRSNISLNRSFIKRMYAFIHKPDYNFYLYNSPEVILERKKELSEKDIIQLNTNYKTLFKEYDESRIKGKYIQLKNEKLSDTIDSVMNQLKEIA